MANMNPTELRLYELKLCCKVMCHHCRKDILYKHGQHYVDDGLQPRGEQGRWVRCYASPIHLKFPEVD